MPLSDARKRANKKWDADNMRNLSIKLRKEYAEQVKIACKEAGTTPGAVMRAAIDSFMNGERAQPVTPEEVQPNDSILTPEAIKAAKEAAALEGEELGVFLTRAIRETAERDEKIRPLLKPQKTQEPPKKEEMPAFNGDFHPRRQEYLNRAKEGSK